MRLLVVGLGSAGRRYEQLARDVLGEPNVRGIRQRDALTSSHDLTSVAMKEIDTTDAVVIATESHLHLPLLKASISRGKNFLVEKPVVTSSGQLADLRNCLAQGFRPRVQMVGFNLRFLGVLTRIVEVIRAGRLGNLVRVSLTASQWLPDWRPTRDYRETYSAIRASGGGVLFDLAHEIDLAHYLFGPFTSTRGLVGKRSSLEIDSSDVAALLLSADDGPIVSVQLDYVARRAIRSYEFVGDGGTLKVDIAHKKAWIENELGDFVLSTDSAEFDIQPTYRTTLEAFLAACSENGAAAPTLEEGLAVTEICLAAEQDAYR